MRTNLFALKSGKSFTSPSYFPNPKSGPEGELLRDMLTRNPLEALGGIVVNIEDMHVVRDELRLRDGTIENAKGDNEINDTVLIVKPDLSQLFGVHTNRDPETIFELDLFPDEFEERFNEADAETGDIQRERKMEDLYSILARPEVLGDIFEYQIESEADIIAPPMVPLTSKVDYEEQLEGVESIFEESRDLVDEGDLSRVRDLMHVVALNPSVMDTPREERENQLVNALTAHDPDIVGISLTNFDIEAQRSNKSILNVIEKLSHTSDAPTLMFNVREFGLMSFVYGADAISTPIAKSPYFRMSEGIPPSAGNYYHKKHMRDYSREDLMPLTRRQNYQLPCDCPACHGHGPFHQMSEDDWNNNRKRHFVFTKESEVRQLRATDTPVHEALREKFGRSERPEFTAYLD